MEYKIKTIKFLNHDDLENRKVVVTLDNGTQIHIVACCESFEQYGGTIDELSTTIDIAYAVNDWLHIEDEPIPDDLEY